jgi:plastocyanin
MQRIVFLIVACCALALPRPAFAANVSGQVHFNVTPKPMVTSKGAQENDHIAIWLTSEDTKPITALPALTISQRNLTFSPAFQVLTLGQELRLPNDDDVAHNVYAMNGPNRFNFGIYKKGEFRSIKFSETGVVDLYCSLHKDMHARLFVVPTPLYASVLPGEQFSIHDVPPGHYVLKAWSFRAARVLTKPITVPKTGSTNLNLTLDYAPSSNVGTD